MFFLCRGFINKLIWFDINRNGLFGWNSIPTCLIFMQIHDFLLKVQLYFFLSKVKSNTLTEMNINSLPLELLYYIAAIGLKNLAILYPQGQGIAKAFVNQMVVLWQPRRKDVGFHEFLEKSARLHLHVYMDMAMPVEYNNVAKWLFVDRYIDYLHRICKVQLLWTENIDSNFWMYSCATIGDGIVFAKLLDRYLNIPNANLKRLYTVEDHLLTRSTESVREVYLKRRADLMNKPTVADDYKPYKTTIISDIRFWFNYTHEVYCNMLPIVDLKKPLIFAAIYEAAITLPTGVEIVGALIDTNMTHIFKREQWTRIAEQNTVCTPVIVCGHRIYIQSHSMINETVGCNCGNYNDRREGFDHYLSKIKLYYSKVQWVLDNYPQ
jgi:hypothetical protein